MRRHNNGAPRAARLHAGRPTPPPPASPTGSLHPEKQKQQQRPALRARLPVLPPRTPLPQRAALRAALTGLPPGPASRPPTLLRSGQKRRRAARDGSITCRTFAPSPHGHHMLHRQRGQRGNGKRPRKTIYKKLPIPCGARPPRLPASGGKVCARVPPLAPPGDGRGSFGARCGRGLGQPSGVPRPPEKL